MKVIKQINKKGPEEELQAISEKTTTLLLRMSDLERDTERGHLWFILHDVVSNLNRADDKLTEILKKINNEE